MTAGNLESVAAALSITFLPAAYIAWHTKGVVGRKGLGGPVQAGKWSLEETIPQLLVPS